MDIDLAAALARLTRYYESLTLQTVANLGEFYTPNAYFKGPFNEVRNSAEIVNVFTRVLSQLEMPHLEITATIQQMNQAFLVWNFQFHLKRWVTTELTIHGASHLRFANDGRVAYHRDFWDAAHDVYENLPVLGHFTRWTRHRIEG